MPDLPGKVARIPVRVGDTVAKGQLLAQLDVDMATLQRDQATAARRLAELGVETAQRELDRAQRLHERGSLTDQQLDQASSALEIRRCPPGVRWARIRPCLTQLTTVARLTPRMPATWWVV